jgi:ACR3 family arsenite efflux pump ArsB
MWKFLAKLNQNLIFAIPAMMLAGFVFGLAVESALLKNLILPFTFLMVYPMMVTLKMRQVLEGGDTKAQVLTQAINFAVIPFVAFAGGKIFFADRPYLALGLLLAALVPTSGMTISWTGFAKGNLAAAVKMTVIGLILGSLATPLYVQALLGAQVQIDLPGVFQQIGLIVFLPMVAGYATQRGLVRRYGMELFQKQLAPRFPGLSTLGVLGIVFIAMALKAKAISARPDQLLLIFVPLLLLYAINYLLSTVTGKMLLPRGDAIALVYGTVMRNLSIALAVAINAFGPAGSEAALVICLAYIIQVQSAAWYVRFTPRLFGTPKAEAQTV